MCVLCMWMMYKKSLYNNEELFIMRWQIRRVAGIRYDCIIIPFHVLEYYILLSKQRVARGGRVGDDNYWCLCRVPKQVQNNIWPGLLDDWFGWVVEWLGICSHIYSSLQCSPWSQHRLAMHGRSFPSARVIVVLPLPSVLTYFRR